MDWTSAIIKDSSSFDNDNRKNMFDQGGDNKQVERMMNGKSGMAPAIPGLEKPSIPLNKGTVKGG